MGSSDGLQRKTKSLRTRSGKKAGGQRGQRGATLHLVATPDVVEEHRPHRCAHCHSALDRAPVVLRERRQVWDLPPVVRLVIHAHQALRLRCPACQAITVGRFPAAAPSRAQDGPRLRAFAVYLAQAQLVPLGRVQQVLADLTGMRLARGTLVGWVQQAAGTLEPGDAGARGRWSPGTLEPVDAALKAALVRAPVLRHDETGVRRGGCLAWAHVASTSRLTHYAIHAQRASAATDAIGILPAFRGVSVHDGWIGYRAYTHRLSPCAVQCAMCNVQCAMCITCVS